VQGRPDEEACREAVVVTYRFRFSRKEIKEFYPEFLAGKICTMSAAFEREMMEYQRLKDNYPFRGERK
jgi:hypothetical protein